MTQNYQSPFTLLAQLNQKVDDLENELNRLKNQIKYDSFHFKQQLLRVNNNDDLSDYTILNSLPYRDLSPEKSFEFYSKKDIDFTVVDVSHSKSLAHHQFEEAIHIPLEDLDHKHFLIGNKKRELLVISEDGVRSILACKKLGSLGYFKINNVSGGYKFWPDQDSIQILGKMRA